MDWVQADLLAWQPAPGSYDLVLIAYLHLPSADLARVFRAACGGPRRHLLVAGHDRDNIARGHGGSQDPDRNIPGQAPQPRTHQAPCLPG